jgi:G6PDH family F420-dependent oxidoreductase
MTQFGYFLSSEELSPQELVRCGQSAVAAGFDRLWVSDHYHPWTTDQGESAFVWSVLGALATTTDAHLTTAVTCPTFRIHPAVLAQASATVACLAPGRFTFGVGSGEALNEHILGDAWPPVSVRLERLVEAMGVIRELWAGGVVTHEGKYFTVHDAKLFSLPDKAPEILVSAFGPKAVAVAAEHGDGWITVQPDAEGMQAYRAAGGGGRTQAGVKVCWAETEDEAAKTAYRLWGFQGAGGQANQDLPTWQSFEGIAELSSPEDMKELVACGPDASRAAEMIAKYVDVGFDEVYVAQMGPQQEEGIAFLREEVLPLLPS